MMSCVCSVSCQCCAPSAKESVRWGQDICGFSFCHCCRLCCCPGYGVSPQLFGVSAPFLRAIFQLSQNDSLQTLTDLVLVSVPCHLTAPGGIFLWRKLSWCGWEDLELGKIGQRLCMCPFRKSLFHAFFKTQFKHLVVI